MQSENKNEWEQIKDTTKELKEALWVIFRSLIFALAILAGVWSFIEIIFQTTLTFLQAALITGGVFAYIVIRAWRNDRKNKIKI